MQKSGSISANDKLFFPGKIEILPYEKRYVALSVETANWIMVNADSQLSMLNDLIAGKTVGEVYAGIASETDLAEFKSLLAAITARRFAFTDSIPQPEVLEGYKMLNCYITNACNLRCEHCFMNSGVSLQNELTLIEWKRVLSEFKNAGGESVTFTGGEPLMNKDFVEIIRHAHDLGLSVTVLSNGVLWNKPKIEECAPYISEIQISIDGFDESTNSVVRGHGFFARVVETVVAFANKNVRTSVATTFTLSNLDDSAASGYKCMVEEIKSRCENPVFFKLSKKILAGRHTNYSEQENKSFYKRIVEIEKAVDPVAGLNNFMEGHTPNLVAKNCGFGGMSIASDGEVYFCNRISEVESYGNVRDKDVSYFLRIGQELNARTSVTNLSPCAQCSLRYVCGGGCRIDDCNFKGKLTGFDGEIKQIKCSQEYKDRLLRKMVESYTYYYKF